MVSHKMRYAIPRISTRGYYDRRTGLAKKTNSFFLYPKYKFKKIEKAEELVIFIHGMRNTRYGAIKGARLLRNRLRKLGYKHPVVAFSYDADIINAHTRNPSKYEQVLKVAEIIAGCNGIYNLTKFIHYIKKRNPSIKIHLVGHSLGCTVIEFTHANVDSVHMFGSPTEQSDLGVYVSGGYFDKLVNYYNKKDEEILKGVKNFDLFKPICIYPVTDKTFNVISKRCPSKDHRFKSYLKELKKFP